MITDGLVLSIHDGDKAVVASKISAVIEDILDGREIDIALWGLVKPMIFDLLDFGFTVSGKLRKPADRVAFLNPKLKPRKLVSFFDVETFPNESLLTLAASKTPFANSCESIMLDVS